MKKIIFATENKSKLLDAQSALKGHDIEIIGKKIDFIEIQSLDQRKIVKHKAKTAHSILQAPLIVDDTAFYIESYNQFPGTLTKHINKALGLPGLLRLFEEGQTAFFRTLICYIDGIHEIIAEGYLRGHLTQSISKTFNADTPLNSIFVPAGYSEPLADLINSSNVRNGHRVAALQNLSEQFTNI